MAKCNLVTGATGLLGSHVAEQLVASGESVRALVRSTSDTAFLRQLGVELRVGNLNDPATLPRAVEGADVVYHCAARVGDWGPREFFQSAIVEATANLLTASKAAGVGRFVHVSSITVYGHPRPRPGELFNEDEPLGQHLWHWDHYCRAKIEAEGLVRAYGPEATIVRPSWIYGPRDRTTLPRIVKALRAGRVKLVGSGDNLINVVYAGDVAAGAILAANHPAARGQAYNLSTEGQLTQREFMDELTDALGLPRVTRQVSFRTAHALGLFAEVVGHAIRMRQPPRITRYAVSLIGRPTQFSIAKAREQLGWEPQVHAREGLRRALEWFFAQQRPTATATGVTVPTPVTAVPR